MAAPNRAAEDLLSAVNRLLELREADEAEHRRQEHAIRQQISNISHDLRTPLTSILGYLQLLEGDSLTVEERREYLGIVRGRAKALQSLITSFYDLSRLEGGEYPLSREKVDLYHVLSELVAEFYNDFEQSGFDMTVELAPGLPAVTADPASGSDASFTATFSCGPRARMAFFNFESSTGSPPAVRLTSDAPEADASCAPASTALRS